MNNKDINPESYLNYLAFQSQVQAQGSINDLMNIDPSTSGISSYGGLVANKPEPTLFTSPVNIAGVGSVPGVFQLYPDGNYRLISIGGDVNRISAPPMPMNSSFSIPPPNQQQVIFNNSASVPNMSSYATTSVTPTPPLQMLDALQQAKVTQSAANGGFHASSQAPVASKGPQPMEMKRGNNTMLRAVTPNPKPEYNDTVDEIAFNNFCRFYRENLISSKYNFTEADLITTCKMSWASFSKENRLKYYKLQSHTDVKPPVVESTPFNSSITNPSLHDHSYTAPKVGPVKTTPNPPVAVSAIPQKPKKKKCPGCSSRILVPYDSELGGFYCNDECVVNHVKSVFYKMYPKAKNVVS